MLYLDYILNSKVNRCKRVTLPVAFANGFLFKNLECVFLISLKRKFVPYTPL